MLTRRHFLGTTLAATAGLALPRRAAAARAPRPTPPARPGVAPDVLARDEAFWQPIQQCFSVDRSLIHLNSGGVCPAPRMVQQAEWAHQEEAGRMPFYAHRSRVRPQVEAIRRRLAEAFGCDAEELAFTRNTSEGMAICQLGFPLRPGDEVVTTAQDYPRMLHTWAQRAQREGLVLKTVPVPVPLADPAVLVAALEAAMTDRTRLVMCCHMIDLTGQLLPVRAITEMAHRRGVPVLVDGAQTFGQMPCSGADLGCDFFATSLHKWLLGPQGTGFLFVRKERLGEVWPLIPAAPGTADDIRKYEDVGTQPMGRLLALGEALTFHDQVGVARKAARLRYLRDYALTPLLAHDRVRLLTHLPTAGALATLHLDGFDPVVLRDHLWAHHRIRVRPIVHEAVQGLRISPGLHTTLGELDRFADVMHTLLRHGLPTS